MKIRLQKLTHDQIRLLSAIPGVRVSRKAFSAEIPPDVRTIAERIIRRPIPWTFVPLKLAVGVENVRGWKRLRPYQQEDAIKLATDEKYLLQLPAGSGKTTCILTAATLRGTKKALIVTRSIGIESYVRDAKWVGGLWLPTGSNPTSDYIIDRPLCVIPIRGRGPDYKVEAAYEVADILVTNYDVLPHRVGVLATLPFDLLVFDESHYLRSPKYKGYAQWAKAAEQLSMIAHWKRATIWEATATPIKDRVRDWYRQLKVLCPDGSWGSSWDWMHAYAAAYINAYGGLVTDGSSNTDDLEERLNFYRIKRTKAEVMKDLPPKRREIVYVDPSDREPPRGKRGVEKAIAYAASLKIPVGAELAADVLSGPGKVVITTNRNRDISAIRKAIERECRSVKDLQIFVATGHDPVASHTHEARDSACRVCTCKAYFEADDPAILIATQDAISESIDLQHTDAMIVLALPYSPGTVDQLEGRTTRLGQDRPVVIYYVVARGTVDDVIDDTLLRKLVAVDATSSGTSGENLADSFKEKIDEKGIIDRMNAWLLKVEVDEEE